MRGIAERTSRTTFISAVVLGLVSLTLGAPAPALAADPPANGIVAENLLGGADPGEWDVSGAGDETLQGFATDISVDQGGSIDFKIDNSQAGTEYAVDIYRLGYYGGDGARLVDTIPVEEVTSTDQDALRHDRQRGLSRLRQLGRLGQLGRSGRCRVRRLHRPAHPRTTETAATSSSSSATTTATPTCCSRPRTPPGRHTTSTAATASTTGPGHAHKVSYNRPFTTREAPTEDWLFNAEYPMIRWLERNGYDVSYSTDVDSDRNGAEITEHKTFMSRRT